LALAIWKKLLELELAFSHPQQLLLSMLLSVMGNYKIAE